MPYDRIWLKTGLPKTNGTSRYPTSAISQNQIARLQTVGEWGSVPFPDGRGLAKQPLVGVKEIDDLSLIEPTVRRP